MNSAMTYKANSLLLLLMLLLVGCTQQAVKLPFECNHRGQMYVTLTVNQKKISGVFDTGAAVSIIHEEKVVEVNLKESGEVREMIFPGLGIDTVLAKLCSPVHVFFNELRTSQKISFYTSPKEVGMTIFGLDLIQQFCWLFDFEQMKVTIAPDTICFEAANCIPIPYKIEDFNMLCSINLGRFIQIEPQLNQSDTSGAYTDENNRLIVNNILIDTGAHGFQMIRDSLIPNVLTLPDEIPGYKFKVGDEYVDESSFIPEDKNYQLFFNDNSSPPRYSGYFNFSKSFASYIQHGYNGILPLGKQSNYSQIYFDTKNQVIYLRPKQS